MIKAATDTLKKLIAGQDVHAALASRRLGTIDRWREMVRAHAAGRSIDLSQLEEVGALLRLKNTATTFAADVAALQQEQAMQADADRAYSEADQKQPREDEAQKELVYFNDNLARIKADAQAASWTRVMAARYASEAMHLRRANPRLWEDAHADEGEAIARDRMARDEVDESPLPIPIQRAPAGGVRQLETVWEK